MAADLQSTLETVWRRDAPRLVGALARLVRDVGLAEQLAQDAMVAALEQWPRSGLPDNPGAWLMATARHRAIDLLRRGSLIAGVTESLAVELDRALLPDVEQRLDDQVGDDLLRLIFVACHPLLVTEARVALTLRLLGGLTTHEIARAFLLPESTVAQRIVRAKRALSEANVPFEVPTGAALAERVSAVLGVVYLIFNEGYSATTGDDLMRPALCDEALRLGRLLARLAPEESEVHALLALMELQSSRARARVDDRGEAVTLLEQDRSLWDASAIARGLEALRRAGELGGALKPYALQAAIAACHARASTATETDWARIAALYDVLAALTPSPVVELNRAVAHSMVFGPESGLRLLEPLRHETALARYHLLPAVRADLLERLGRLAEAQTEFERAAEWTQNSRERAVLLARAKHVISNS